MKRINLYLIAWILAILVAIWIFRPDYSSDVSLFGFTDNLETEINFPYPVLVEDILVNSGEKVESGTILLRLRRTPSSDMPDPESFELAQTTQELTAWKQKKEKEMESLRLEWTQEQNKAEWEIGQIERKIASYSAIRQGLTAFDSIDATQSLRLEWNDMIRKKELADQGYEQQLRALEEEIRLGMAPFRTKMEELQAIRKFTREWNEQVVEIRAPYLGLIGDLNCRENEHLPAFRTLLTFYEPHPTIVRGYIHENQILEVALADLFTISSLQNPEITYTGKVIGLGSRIVEIPARMRKYPQVKSYGREITLEIPTDNVFLQTEKVSLRKIQTND